LEASADSNLRLGLVHAIELDRNLQNVAGNVKGTMSFFFAVTFADPAIIHPAARAGLKISVS
jgi:hypothetical protein